MQVFRRFFQVTSGPAFDRAVECHKINEAAKVQYRKVLREIGAREDQYHSFADKLTGVLFDGDVCRKKYRPAEGGGWYPKQNRKEGKSLHARIQGVETCDLRTTVSRVLDLASLYDAGNHRIYMPCAFIIPSDPIELYVAVPWHNVSTRRLKKYRADKEASGRGSANLEALLWEPPEGLLEMDEDEVKDRVKLWNHQLPKDSHTK